jgi:polysaccharide pyruvyl transferase WcaK-like protein
MITHIRERITDAEILGITLNPENTSRRHKIAAIPLTGLSLEYYHVSHPPSPTIESPSHGNLYLLKDCLKKFPLFFRFLRAIRRLTSMLVSEAAHIMTASGVVRKLDILIICGGGALDESWGGPWGHPWTLLKWGLLSRAFRVPLLFVSVGKSFLERPLSRYFAGIALRLAQYRSYRENDSRIWLQKLLDTSRDPVYPDLAFSFPCPVRQAPDDCCPEDEQLVVGVSPIAYCDPRVWPYKDERRYAAYLNRMAEMVLWILGEGHRVLFFATDSPDDRTIEDLLAILAGRGVPRSTIDFLPSPVEPDTDDVGNLIEGIRRAGLVIASRLHGVILSHLNSIPVLALSFDPKVDAHMKSVGQMDYCLNIDDITSEMLVSRFCALKAFREEERAHIRSATVKFRHLLDLQYDQIFGPLQYFEKSEGFWML